MDASLNSALDQSFVRSFVAIQIKLTNDSVINLIDGSGEVSFPVDGATVTFDGDDAIYGALATAKSFEDTVASDAPRFTFSIMPPSATATAELANPKHQGSPVRVWFGVVNEMTGTVIGVPELLWVGRLDFVRTQIGENAQLVEIETVSAFDRLFVAEEGARLNGNWHKRIWPGETGLDFNIDAQGDIFWGIAAPTAAAVRTPTGGWANIAAMLNNR
ncbi:hypothetical protein HH800_15585 [Sphingobium yanoikuyae]|uniref:DUF2163 domain-containing protein n=1 Tax=Sphingobium yanoikuyae TaxID=13690 RepID=A0A6M4GAZ7_SPHYA|nr:hypothetical protein [Sphingobium yanoikuyae]QJR03473.1 hypothetical protein HH800_15585 [Sphingobium yanoikuyae]